MTDIFRKFLCIYIFFLLFFFNIVPMNKAPEKTKIREEHFSLFYKKYFEDFMSYEIVESTVQRFAFIFQYLKIRNIGDLNLENNKQIDCINRKKLTKEEREAIVSFFLETIKPLGEFKDYIQKVNNENEEEFREDQLYKAFQKIRDELKDLPEIEDMCQHAENLTFLVKNASFKVSQIQSNISSDVHSSPEYFALEYQKFDKESVSLMFQKKGCNLEALFNEFKTQMKRKEVSFFCGDLDDRHKFDFLDPKVKRDQKQRDIDYAKRENFLLYNCFKDFYHTVHAAYQLYCLYNGKTEDILRFQVSGNHEELNLNAAGDKKNELNYFSSLISYVRKFMLPTELNFVLKSGGLATLRHGFFPQEMNKEWFTGKRINQNFKIFYLHIKTADAVSKKINDFEYAPTSLQPLRTGDKSLMNPQLWSDFYNTQNKLDLDTLLMDRKEEEKEIFGFAGEANQIRGFYNKGSLKRGILEGKAILLNNFQISNDDNFLSPEEIEVLKNKPCFLFCGHSHNQESLKYSLLQVGNALSFRPYWIRDDQYAFHFCLCSHHNLYIQLYKNIYDAYIKESEQEDLILDWSQSEAINLLNTVYGKEWMDKCIGKASTVLRFFIEKQNKNLLKSQEKNLSLNKDYRALQENKEKLLIEMENLRAEFSNLTKSEEAAKKDLLGAEKKYTDLNDKRIKAREKLRKLKEALAEEKKKLEAVLVTVKKENTDFFEKFHKKITEFITEKNREYNLIKSDNESLNNHDKQLALKYVSLENNPFIILGKVALAAGAISSARRIQKYFTAKEAARSFRKYVVKIQPIDVFGGVALVGAHAFYKRYKNADSQSTTRKPSLEQKS